MGHANTTNISQLLNRMLRQGPTTIKQCVDELERTKQALHAGEGNLTERCMLGHGTEMVVGILLENEAIEPVTLTRRQAKILQQWKNEETDEWDCGNDGEGGEYAIFDSIPWRPKKKRVPLVRYVEN